MVRRKTKRKNKKKTKTRTKSNTIFSLSKSKQSEKSNKIDYKTLSNDKINLINNYKIAIPSRLKSKILKNKTLKLLQLHNIDSKKIHIFVNSNDEKKIYEKNISREMYGTIVVAHGGAMNVRNYITTYFAEGSALLCLDDDISNINILDIEENKEIELLASIRPLIDLNSLLKEGFTECLVNNLGIFGIFPEYKPNIMRKNITYDLRLISNRFFGVINIKNISETIYPAAGYERTLKYYIKNGGVVRFNNIVIKRPSSTLTLKASKSDEISINLINNAANKLSSLYPSLCSTFIRKTVSVKGLEKKITTRKLLKIRLNNLDREYSKDIPPKYIE